MQEFVTSDGPHNMQEFWVENGAIHTKNYATIKLDVINNLSQKFYDKKILDIGSNDGLYSLACKQNGAQEVVANEIDEISLNTSKRLFSLFSQDVKTNGKNLFLEESTEHKCHFDYVVFLTVIHRLWYPQHSNKFPIDYVFDCIDFYCKTGIVTDYWIRKSNKEHYKQREFEEFIFNRYRVKSLGEFESDWWESKVYLLLQPARFIL